METKIKIALIAAVAAVAAVTGSTWIVMENSPYQTCVKAKTARIVSDVLAVRDEGGLAAELAAEAAIYSDEPPAPAPKVNVEETTAEAKRTAEIMCAGAQP